MVKLYFSTEEEAVRYCEQHSFEYAIEGPKPIEKESKSYAENFRYTGNDDKLPRGDFW
jgi:hypothetical protein